VIQCLLYLIVCTAIPCCATTPSFQSLQPTLDPQGHYISDVPFISQKKDRCGPAALAMVLRYWGAKVSEKDVAREVYLPLLQGALLSDLRAYAEQRGFKAHSYMSGMDDLRYRITRNEPLILLLDLGGESVERPHYVVAIGFQEAKKLLIIHSGRKENQVCSYKKILNQWAKMNYLALLVQPKQ